MTPDLQQRVARERAAHTEDDVLARSYVLKDRFAHIWSYPSRKRLEERLSLYLSDLKGKRVLDYGCGRGDASLRYLNSGAHVTGIDISKPYVEDADRRAREAGFELDQFSFHVMDAHDLAFPDASFDVVVGFGILHHLDPEVALREIQRVLLPGGRVLLQEPLADNPLLRVFRLLTPSARTADEAPFTGDQVAQLTHQPGWEADSFYCGLLEAPIAMLTSLLLPRHPQNVFLQAADTIERWCHVHHVLDSWNQYITFNLVKR